MAITRIDFAGGDKTAMSFVTVSRRIGSPTIHASILTPREHFELSARADDRDGLLDLAARVQQAIDGHRGTNSMIHDYYQLVQRLGA
jgi:hypothetical protein